MLNNQEIKEFTKLLRKMSFEQLDTLIKQVIPIEISHHENNIADSMLFDSDIKYGVA